MASLFDSFQLGGQRLPQRLVVAPTTPAGATADGPVVPSTATCSAQRATAGLITTGGVQPGLRGRSTPSTPGLHPDAQVEARHAVTDAVHTDGGRTSAQILHGGHVGHSTNPTRTRTTRAARSGTRATRPTSTSRLGARAVRAPGSPSRHPADQAPPSAGPDLGPPPTTSTVERQEHSMSEPQSFVTPEHGKTMHQRLHHSRAVRIGDRTQTSGQGGWDDDSNTPEALDAEIRQAFDDAERVLAAAGATWGDAAHVNSHHVPQADRAIGDGHHDVMAEQFRLRTGERAPIWTQTGVPALGLARMRTEIRVTAIAAPDA